MSHFQEFQFFLLNLKKFVGNEDFYDVYSKYNFQLHNGFFFKNRLILVIENFENRGVTQRNSDSDFRDQPDKLLHTKQQKNSKKNC